MLSLISINNSYLKIWWYDKPERISSLIFGTMRILNTTCHASAKYDRNCYHSIIENLPSKTTNTDYNVHFTCLVSHGFGRYIQL